MTCAICRERRGRRFCPGVRGDICTLCCGTEREVTVDCPLDCEFLHQARRHDKPVTLDPERIPNRDIRVTNAVLDEHPQLLSFLGRTLLRAAMSTAGSVDLDVREALEALIRTYRTLESGVYYETVPSNLLAANIYRFVQQSLDEFRRNESERFGVSRTRDALVLACLLFYQRRELGQHNGRPRCRVFLSDLLGFYGEAVPSPSRGTSSLILP